MAEYISTKVHILVRRAVKHTLSTSVRNT